MIYIGIWTLKIFRAKLDLEKKGLTTGTIFYKLKIDRTSFKNHQHSQN